MVASQPRQAQIHTAERWKPIHRIVLVSWSFLFLQSFSDRSIFGIFVHLFPILDESQQCRGHSHATFIFRNSHGRLSQDLCIILGLQFCWSMYGRARWRSNAGGKAGTSARQGQPSTNRCWRKRSTETGRTCTIWCLEKYLGSFWQTEVYLDPFECWKVLTLHSTWGFKLGCQILSP